MAFFSKVAFFFSCLLLCKNIGGKLLSHFNRVFSAFKALYCDKLDIDGALSSLVARLTVRLASLMALTLYIRGN